MCDEMKVSALKYVHGNILTPNTDDKGVLVCHQVNCKGVMGAGLALQVRNMHPGIYSLYRDKCRQIAAGIGGLGDVQLCSALSSSGYIVANVFGQDGYGRNRCHTDYDALRKAFEYIATGFPAYTIRIPYMMGCGLAGGDWKMVFGIIKETLVDAGVNVEIWQKDI